MDYLIQSHSNALDYAAGGFKDFSRIASSDATMWRDICINNPNEIVQAHLNDSELNNPSMKMPTYVVNARSLPINHRVFCHS
jgi:prephenate dehydrogenase